MWSKGICWIDDCRIPFVDDSENTSRVVLQTQSWANTSTKGVGTIDNNWKQGRFPANILVSDDVLNDGVISNSSLFPKTNTPIFDNKQGWNNNNISGSTGGGYNDKGTNSRYYDIDKWFDKLLND